MSGARFASTARREIANAKKYSALEDNLGQRQIPAMRNRKRNVFHAKPLRYFSRDSVQTQRWFATRFAQHFDIPPAYARSPSRSQRLHRRLFRCKSPRVAFEFRAETLAVRDFCRSVQPLQNRRAVPRQRRFDAVNLRDVQSQAYDHMRLASKSRGKMQVPNRNEIIPRSHLKYASRGRAGLQARRHL